MRFTPAVVALSMTAQVLAYPTTLTKRINLSSVGSVAGSEISVGGKKVGGTAGDSKPDIQAQAEGLQTAGIASTEDSDISKGFASAKGDGFQATSVGGALGINVISKVPDEKNEASSAASVQAASDEGDKPVGALSVDGQSIEPAKIGGKSGVIVGGNAGALASIAGAASLEEPDSKAKAEKVGAQAAGDEKVEAKAEDANVGFIVGGNEVPVDQNAASGILDDKTKATSLDAEEKPGEKSDLKDENKKVKAEDIGDEKKDTNSNALASIASQFGISVNGKEVKIGGQANAEANDNSEKPKEKKDNDKAAGEGLKEKEDGVEAAEEGPKEKEDGAEAAEAAGEESKEKNASIGGEIGFNIAGKKFSLGGGSGVSFGKDKAEAKEAKSEGVESKDKEDGAEAAEAKEAKSEGLESKEKEDGAEAAGEESKEKNASVGSKIGFNIGGKEFSLGGSTGVSFKKSDSKSQDVSALGAEAGAQSENVAALSTEAAASDDSLSALAEANEIEEGEATAAGKEQEAGKQGDEGKSATAEAKGQDVKSATAESKSEEGKPPKPEAKGHEGKPPKPEAKDHEGKLAIAEAKDEEGKPPKPGHEGKPPKPGHEGKQAKVEAKGEVKEEEEDKNGNKGKVAGAGAEEEEEDNKGKVAGAEEEEEEENKNGNKGKVAGAGAEEEEEDNKGKVAGAGAEEEEEGKNSDKGKAAAAGAKVEGEEEGS